jgi:hypothetical protein
MRRRPALLTALVGLTVLAGGCSNGTGAASSPRPGKFDQTWAKKIGDTTCGDWHSRMKQNERFVASADMLVSMQSADGGKEVLPEDSVITDFAANISTACEADAGQGITDIGATVYTVGRATFGP